MGRIIARNCGKTTTARERVIATGSIPTRVSRTSHVDRRYEQDVGPRTETGTGRRAAIGSRIGQVEGSYSRSPNRVRSASKTVG